MAFCSSSCELGDLKIANSRFSILRSCSVIYFEVTCLSMLVTIEQKVEKLIWICPFDIQNITAVFLTIMNFSTKIVLASVWFSLKYHGRLAPLALLMSSLNRFNRRTFLLRCEGTSLTAEDRSSDGSGCEVMTRCSTEVCFEGYRSNMLVFSQGTSSLETWTSLKVFGFGCFRSRIDLSGSSSPIEPSLKW